MANQIADSKKQISLTLDRELLDSCDKEAKKKGISRASLIALAIQEYLEKGLEFEVIKAKLDSIESQNVAATAMLVETIKNQPIAIQEAAPAPALPDPEKEEPEYRRTILGLYRKVK